MNKLGASLKEQIDIRGNQASRCLSSESGISHTPPFSYPPSADFPLPPPPAELLDDGYKRPEFGTNSRESGTQSKTFQMLQNCVESGQGGKQTFCVLLCTFSSMSYPLNLLTLYFPPYHLLFHSLKVTEICEQSNVLNSGTGHLI